MNRIHALILAAAVGAMPLGSAAAQDKENAERRGPGRPGMMMGRGMGAPDMAGRILELRSELDLTERQVEQLTRIQKEYAAKNEEHIQKLRAAQDETIKARRQREDEVRRMTVEERRKVLEERREEMEEVREERRKAMEEAREDRREAMEEIREQRMKELERRNPELAKAQQELRKSHEEAAKEIRDVLTDEQEKRLEERMDRRRAELREDIRERRPAGRRAPGRQPRI